MRESGVTGADIVRSTGRSASQIDQYMAGMKPLSPDVVEHLPTALRVRLTCRAYERAVEARDGRVSSRAPHQHIEQAAITVGEAVAVHAEVWADGKLDDHERPRLVRAWTRAEGALHNNARDVARTGTR